MSVGECKGSFRTGDEFGDESLSLLRASTNTRYGLKVQVAHESSTRRYFKFYHKRKRKLCGWKFV